MITIDLNPNIFAIGNLLITWHGFFSAVGLVVGVWLAAVRARDDPGISAEQVYGVAPWGALGGVIGARLFHVVDRWDIYKNNLISIFAINEGGIAIYGAIVGGILGGLIYAWPRRYPIGRLLDAGGLGLIVGQAIGRVGDVINGEHWGAVVNGLPWGTRWINPANTLSQCTQKFGPLNAQACPYEHPAVLYELLWNMAVFILLVALVARLTNRPGVIFWLYMMGYAIGRFWITFYRVGDVDTLVIGDVGLKQAQVVGILLFLLSLAGLASLYWRARREPPPTAPVDSEAARPASGVSGSPA